MKNSILMLNMAIDIFAIAISIIGITAAVIASRVNKLVKRYFITIFIVDLLYVLSNFGGLVMKGGPGIGIRVGLYIANFGEFMFSELLAHITSIYLLDISIEDRESRVLMKLMVNALTLFHFMMLVISQFTGLYYSINENNYYVRSYWYPLSYLSSIVILVIDVVVLLEERKKLTAKQIVAFWLYLILPLVAIVLQMFTYGINFIVVAVVVAGFAMFILIMADQIERTYQIEVEIANTKASLLLGQISPHFIFNSLMSIQDLCYSEPEKAAKSIGDFAGYLRHNMEEMSSSAMIDFEKELEYIKEYVRLEKTDPDRNFDVEYDLEVSDFKVPTLTLQPIVENAINYGALTCYKEKGKVVLHTYEKDGEIVIDVWNNAEGKASRTSGQKKSRSVALENIKSRLDHYCKGYVKTDIGEKESTVSVHIPLPQKGED